MIDYFKGCENKEDRKKRYYELARKHHPDTGGDVKVMQEINQQFRHGKTLREVAEEILRKEKQRQESMGSPCPFCGKRDLRVIYSTEVNNIAKIQCKHCGATGPQTYVGQNRSHYAKWNERN